MFQSNFEVKDAFLFVPALATTLALTYDVGFFVGFDIRYFTLFSIAEHIVFSLSILPLAILLSIVLLLASRANDSSASGGLFLVVVDGLRRVAQNSIMLLAIVFILVGLPTVLAGWSIWEDKRTIEIAICLQLGSLSGVGLLFLREAVSARAWIAYAISALFMITLSLGMFVGEKTKTSKVFNQVVKTATVQFSAKIVRSGERGILFVDAKTDRVVLLPWQLVVEISGPQR